MTRSPDDFKRKKCDRCGKDFIKDFWRPIDRIIECSLSQTNHDRAPPPLPEDTSRMMFTNRGIGFVTAYLCPNCKEDILEFSLDRRLVRSGNRMVKALIFLAICPACKNEYMVGWALGVGGETALKRDYQMIQQLKRTILGERTLFPTEDGE